MTRKGMNRQRERSKLISILLSASIPRRRSHVYHSLEHPQSASKVFNSLVSIFLWRITSNVAPREFKICSASTALHDLCQSQKCFKKLLFLCLTHSFILLMNGWNQAGLLFHIYRWCRFVPWWTVWDNECPVFITIRSVCFLLICGRTTRYTSPLTRCLSSESPPLKNGRYLSRARALWDQSVWPRAWLCKDVLLSRGAARDMIIFIVKLFFLNFTFSPSCLTSVPSCLPHHLYLSPSVLLHALNARVQTKHKKITPFASHLNQVDTIKTHDLFALSIFNLISVVLWM